MVTYFVVWMLSMAAAGISMLLLRTRIVDDLETHLPLDERPSWRAWQLRRFPLYEIRRHRQMYPNSSLRRWYAAAAAIQAALVLGPFIYYGLLRHL